MKKNITLLYTSRSGFTGKGAEIASDIIREAGHRCTLLNATEEPVMEDSDLVIIGGPIIMGKMPPEISQSVKKNRHILEKSSVAVFFTCLRLTEASGGPELPFQVYADHDFKEIHESLKAMSPLAKNHETAFYFNNFLKTFPWLPVTRGAVFKGGLDYSRLNILQRVFMRFMSLIQKDQQEGDFIDRDIIKKWVDTLL